MNTQPGMGSGQIMGGVPGAEKRPQNEDEQLRDEAHAGLDTAIDQARQQLDQCERRALNFEGAMMYELARVRALRRFLAEWDDDSPQAPSEPGPASQYITH